MEKPNASLEIITLPLDRAGERIDKLLAEFSELSRERIKALIGEGLIIGPDGKPVTGSAKAVAGDYSLSIPAAAPLEVAAEAIPLNIVYEDASLIVIDKPAGMVVHPAAGNESGTLVNALLHHCAGRLPGIGGVERPGIVHRIDKDTSGLLVVAKTDKTHEGLAKQFAGHSIERQYKAIVSGRPAPSSGTIDAPLARSAHDRKKIAIVTGSRGKHAVTHYKTEKILRDAALVSCTLETGRTHQIRVHMASIGHSLLGDPVYGRTRNPEHRKTLKDLDFNRQALHAEILGFIHPETGEKLRFISEVPLDMQQLLIRLAL